MLIKRLNAQIWAIALILSVVASIDAALATAAMAQARSNQAVTQIYADEPVPLPGGPFLSIPAAFQYMAQPASATHLGHYTQVPAGAYMPKAEHVEWHQAEFFAAGGAPANQSANALRRLGQEPRLRDSREQAAAADAPQAVTVQQSTTQDLSLPEDQYEQKRAPGPSSGLNLFKRTNQMVIQRGLGLGQQVINRGSHF